MHTTDHRLGAIAARTLLDLGAVLGDEATRDAVDVARRRYRLEWDELAHVTALHSVHGRPGLGTTRRILGEHYREEAVTDSRLERLVERLLVSSGIPRPTLHHRVVADGRVYELDLAWPARKVAVELDGAHHRSERAFHADRARRNRLILAGWVVLHYTWIVRTRGCARLALARCGPDGTDQGRIE